MPTGPDAALSGAIPPTLTRAQERELAELSPFEFKTRLLEIAAASAAARGTRMLDAGRGNPNWVATTPRGAFFLLGRFALGESRRVWEEPDLGGMPAAAGIAVRLDAFLADHADAEGAALLAGTVAYGESLGFDADAFVYELTDGVIGDHYPGRIASAPTPSRSCVSTSPTSCSRARRRPATGTSSRWRGEPRPSVMCSTRSPPTCCCAEAIGSR